MATPSELRGLIAALRGLDRVPPLVAVDQEGGRVARLGEPVTPVPSAMALAATGDDALCGGVAERLGRELAELGVSVDFAPVADLALEPANTVIGTRSFGEEPQAVARRVTAFARGLTRGGVAAALKHFPGHGATATDSHLAVPHIEADAATLRTRDLVPFAAAIAEGSAAIVMTAHVVVEALDPERPASMSPRVVTGLLREELGFRGVACTDCLEMEAIAGGPGTVEAAVQALAAGMDLLLVSHTLATAETAAGAIVAAVTAGRLPESRLREAAGRVRALRERAAAVTAEPAGATAVLAALDVARRGITVVRGDARLRAKLPVTVISFEGTVFDGAAGARPAGTGASLPSLNAALRARRWKSELMRVALDPDDDDLELLLAHLPTLGARNFVLVVRRAHLHPAQRAAVTRILALAPDALVVSAAEPYDALLWPGARHVLCTYGDDALAFGACADVLSGRAAPLGRLPVTIDAVR